MTEETTAIVETPQVRAIVAPPGNFAAYMTDLIGRANAEVEGAEAKVLVARQGVAAAERATEPAQLSKWRRQLTRALKVQRRAEMFRDALRAGYVPLPRMPAVSLQHVQQLMPADVLDAMTEAREAGLFETFRVIDGRDAGETGWPREWGANKRRDPILVGIIGQERFAIAWWRP